MDLEVTFDFSALVLLVPEVEGIVGPYRRKYTADGIVGMPAHITILYPFITNENWNHNSRNLLAEAVSGISPFSFHLSNLRRFAQERVLYLELSPKEKILQVIHTVMQIFPDFPPYGGTISFDQLVPHLTVAAGSTSDELALIEEEFNRKIASRFPLEVAARELWFVVNAAGRWRRILCFPFKSKCTE